MISLELAEKLRSAGLVCRFKFSGFDLEKPGHSLWLPSLENLLDEIQNRGHYVFLSGPYFKQKEWRCRLDEAGIETINSRVFVGSAPEDAVGLALLWILERENRT